MGKKPRILREDEILRAGIGGASELEENPRPRQAPGKPRSGMEFTDSMVPYKDIKTDGAGLPLLPKRNRPEPRVDMTALEEIEAEPATASELEDLRRFESKHSTAARNRRETILVNGLKVHRDVGVAHLKAWYDQNVRREGERAKEAIGLLEKTYEQVYAEPFPEWASGYLRSLI